MRSKRLGRFLRALSSALICVLAGVALGYVEMALIAFLRPGEGQGTGIVPALAAAFEGGLMPLMRGGADGFVAEAAKAAPAMLLAIGVAFAWRAGLYQLGGAGQYALGVAACAACGSLLSWPWYACVIAAAIAGGLTGAFNGWLKSRFSVHEGLSTALTAWIGVYAAGALMKCFDGKAMADPGLALPMAVLPAVLALLLWLGMTLTAAGWAHGVRGDGETIARYTGMNVGKTAVITLTASGTLAGLAGGAAWCLGLETQAPGIGAALSGPGLAGLTAGILAGGNPLGAVAASGVIAQLKRGAESLNAAVFSPEMGDWVLAQILFIGAAMMLPRRRTGKGGRSA